MDVARARVVLVTTPDDDVARRIARAVVEERLAACGNIVPALISIFRWQGAVQEEREALLVLKTTIDRFDALRERVIELHPYDVPEVLALGVEQGHAQYLDWLAACVGPAEDDDGT